MLRNITFFFLYFLCISVGYAQKNRIFQHKEIKKYVIKHKSIAILPFKVIIEQASKRSEDSTAYTLREEARREGYQIPLTCTFLWITYAKPTAPQLQSWDKSSKILADINYQPSESVLKDSLKKIARLLQVDALIVGFVHAYQDKYTTNYGKTHFASEEVVSVYLAIYDGETGALVWQNEDSSAYSLRLEERISLGKNTEIILARIFARLPYTKKKRN